MRRAAVQQGAADIEKSSVSQTTAVTSTATKPQPEQSTAAALASTQSESEALPQTEAAEQTAEVIPPVTTTAQTTLEIQPRLRKPRPLSLSRPLRPHSRRSPSRKLLQAWSLVSR